MITCGQKSCTPFPSGAEDASFRDGHCGPGGRPHSRRAGWSASYPAGQYVEDAPRVFHSGTGADPPAPFQSHHCAAIGTFFPSGWGKRSGRFRRPDAGLEAARAWILENLASGRRPFPHPDLFPQPDGEKVSVAGRRRAPREFVPRDGAVARQRDEHILLAMAWELGMALELGTQLPSHVLAHPAIDSDQVHRFWPNSKKIGDGNWAIHISICIKTGNGHSKNGGRPDKTSKIRRPAKRFAGGNRAMCILEPGIWPSGARPADDD
eukprot:gene14159-biopygen12554